MFLDPNPADIEDENVRLLNRKFISSLVDMMVEPGMKTKVLSHSQYPDLAEYGPSLAGLKAYSNMP